MDELEVVAHFEKHGSFRFGAPLSFGLIASFIWRQRIIPAAEALALIASPIFWGRGVPHGDSHAVLVIPGWGGSDFRASLLRNWLKRVGYRPISSGQAIKGWSAELIHQIAERADDAYRRTSSRITIIGHSWGGLVARRVAIDRPAVVQHVIALGASLAWGSGTVPSTAAMTAIYGPDDVNRGYMDGYPGLRDGHVKLIEVRTTHGAYLFSRRVYHLLASLLREPASSRG
jgi:pimeloyl-ACP methyl ester carboxylesterase